MAPAPTTPAKWLPPPPAHPVPCLYPLDDTLIPKQIALASGICVKIGRQTNARTAPGERNSFFDSEVLNRQHVGSPPPHPPRSPPNAARHQTVRRWEQYRGAGLHETQSSFQAHVDKICALECLVEEHQAIKREVDSMREMLTRPCSPLLAPARPCSPLPLQLQIKEGGDDLGQHGSPMLARRRESEDEYGDNLDVRSVCTVTPQAEEEERHTVGRPKTPEPTALHDQNAMLAARLESLTTQLEQAIVVSQGLQTHAARASSTIATLEARIDALEAKRALCMLGGQLPPADGSANVSKSEGPE
ncbi:hypothetical protein FRC06_010862 [Ceratobasidium sp. 370]|nr:hypothetical protein FRC06_010862 [Ceratobasidium sp. 370]